MPPKLLTAGARLQINLIAGSSEGLQEPERGLRAGPTPRGVHLPSPRLSFCSRRLSQHEHSACELFRLFLLIRRVSPVSSLLSVRSILLNEPRCRILLSRSGYREFAALPFASSSRLSVNRSVRKRSHWLLFPGWYMAVSLFFLFLFFGSQDLPVPYCFAKSFSQGAVSKAARALKK